MSPSNAYQAWKSYGALARDLEDAHIYSPLLGCTDPKDPVAVEVALERRKKRVETARRLEAAALADLLSGLDTAVYP